MYRAAASFDPGSPDYLKIYETAVREYPDDRIANNNAAAALLAEGETGKAKAYLEKGEENDPAAYLNLGTYYYIEGDLSKAEHYFRLAQQAGVQQAEQNLRLLQETAK